LIAGDKSRRIHAGAGAAPADTD